MEPLSQAAIKSQTYGLQWTKSSDHRKSLAYDNEIAIYLPVKCTSISVFFRHKIYNCMCNYNALVLQPESGFRI